MSLLGIDMGSDSCKAVVFDHVGRILAHDSRRYTTSSPSPGMVEIDPGMFWQVVVSLTRDLSQMVADDPIESLAISSHGETFVAVDKAGCALAPAIMNSDHRAVEQAKWWADALGKEKIYGITGLPLHPMFSMAKMMWLKKHEPTLFNKAARFVCVEDYLLMRMGLPAYTNYSSACRTMAFDITAKIWSEEILKCAGISEDQLSMPLPSGQQAGRLSSSVASEMGLRESTTVAMGGHDQPCGALGCGAVHPGQVSDSAGTYECMVAVSEHPHNCEKALSANLNSYCHVVPDRYVTLAFFPAGIASRWFIEQFCGEERLRAEENNTTVYQILDAAMEQNCPGPTGVCFTPHLIGSCNPYWDVRATGVVAGLTPQVTRHHVYKALHEGLACELAVNTSVLEDIVGPFDHIRIYGGNARSEGAVQLRADLSGKTMQTLHNHEAVCQGAAILAGIATGVYNDPTDAVERIVKIKRDFEPDVKTHEKYEKQLKQYRQIYPSLEAFRSI